MTYKWLQSTVLKSNFDSDKKESVLQQEIILVYLLITVDLTVFWSFDKSEKKSIR
jgi:hypothetical protein